jgi:hypothetical protein
MSSKGMANIEGEFSKNAIDEWKIRNIGSRR